MHNSRQLMASSQLFRYSRLRVFLLLASATLTLYYFRCPLKNAWVIARMPILWKSQASEFLISKEKDDFDVSFMNYSKTVDTALPEHINLVPPVLHHITLGKNHLNTSWVNARESCLQYHPGWKSYLWTDENSGPFVEEHFPNFKRTWDNYKYLIQKIDALRYMVLYQYGGTDFQGLGSSLEHMLTFQQELCLIWISSVLVP